MKLCPFQNSLKKKERVVRLDYLYSELTAVISRASSRSPCSSYFDLGKHSSLTSDSSTVEKEEYHYGNGTITSRNFPLDYNNNENYTYHISVEPTYAIQLKFNAFNTFSYYDYVEVSC